ncbi:MAG: hypothetical protein JXA38_05680 [Methanosarcinaceae archaeon]|nr:hypothetical protein [Methanosarcinaceae archaeon]
MADREKVTGFRLPTRTLYQLEELQELGHIKNRTDGVIKAIDQFYTKESLKGSLFLQMLASASNSQFPAKEWEYQGIGNTMHILGDIAEEDCTIVKKGNNKAIIIQSVGDKRIILTLEYEIVKKESTKKSE